MYGLRLRQDKQGYCLNASQNLGDMKLLLRLPGHVCELRLSRSFLRILWPIISPPYRLKFISYLLAIVIDVSNIPVPDRKQERLPKSHPVLTVNLANGLFQKSNDAPSRLECLSKFTSSSPTPKVRCSALLLSRKSTQLVLLSLKRRTCSVSQRLVLGNFHKKASLSRLESVLLSSLSHKLRISSNPYQNLLLSLVALRRRKVPRLPKRCPACAEQVKQFLLDEQSFMATRHSLLRLNFVLSPGKAQTSVCRFQSSYFANAASLLSKIRSKREPTVAASYQGVCLGRMRSPSCWIL